MYFDELVQLFEQIQEANSPQDPLGYSSNRFDPSKFETRLNELVTDLIQFSRNDDNSNLFHQLEEIVTSNHGGYGVPDPTELEAKIRRIDRAIRVYAHVGGKTESGTNKTQLVTSNEGGPPAKKSNKVFVVHGHDEAVLHEVCRLIIALGLEPVVLREQPNRGKTIIEKFEANSDVGFAVVLMTADDMGGTLEEVQRQVVFPRTRQNVILEMGYFIAKLKRENVTVLKSEGVEEPSDIFGVIYTAIDKHGAWKLFLSKEIKSAGYEVDLNKV